MHQIHPQARTTPAVRVEIARSWEATGVLARRYGISDETVRKWRDTILCALGQRDETAWGDDKNCSP